MFDQMAEVGLRDRLALGAVEEHAHSKDSICSAKPRENQISAGVMHRGKLCKAGVGWGVTNWAEQTGLAGTRI